MTDINVKERNRISDEYKWNIEDMFPDESVINKILEEILSDAKKYTAYQGHLTDDANTLLNALKDKDALWMKLEKVCVYSRMKRDEDNRVTKYQAMTDKCHTVIASVAALTSFFTPELISKSEKKVLSYINECPELEIYTFMISDTFRQKKHILSQAEENIIAQMDEVTGAASDIFTMLNNADIKFGEITDSDGKKAELTHGNYISFMESKNRNVRKDAFEHMHKAFSNLINTIASAYKYSAKKDVISARIRKYSSAREAALSIDNVPISVYDNLIKSVNNALPAMHKYMKLRKKLLGVKELHMYDLYVPLICIPEEKIPFKKGLDIMRTALSPLGEEYIDRMNNGIDAGWIDVYENAGKTSGAYSFGSYDSMPYILLNYDNRLNDVFTIVHEMGHSMHSSYTRQYQPYIYGSHSIFTAEVASTVNESLLMKHLLKNETDVERRKYLLNKYIEEFRTTLFRQTMFAEFEQITHEAIENDHALTAEIMSDEYGKLNEKYFGSDVVIDEQIKYEWARIPHFYTAFYVYKYATGFSAASAISEKILNEGEKARKSYIEFLKTGESDYPVELLKTAGVDMSKSKPVNDAMETFKNLVDEFGELV